MKIFELTLKPLSGFGTPLKGDTIFGHICWQAFYDDSLFGKTISELIADYDKDPFIVVSSAFFKVSEKEETYRIFKRPDLPISKLFIFKDKETKDIIANRKVLKSQKWLLLRDSEKILNLKGSKYISESDLYNIIQANFSNKNLKGTSIFKSITQPHNTINRLTNTTGEGRFAPFSSEQIVFNENVMLIIYAGIREDIRSEQLETAFQRIGDAGFGRDASTGLGKFRILSVQEIDLFKLGSPTPNACYSLSPCVPQNDSFIEFYFNPFTKFGRHGDVLAKSTNPFKNPVLMADEGAVFIPRDIKEILKKPYIGKALKGVSKVMKDSVAQGYSLYIPVSMEA
ncbi:MAG TPA: hypothetical protein PKW07_03485 [Syntrophorhabdaceae bacterium]|nr:hypothetical protein [Syntrophorhabdaceae bacterium]